MALRDIVEAALFAAREPLSVARIQALFDDEEEDRPLERDVRDALNALEAVYRDHALALVETASGFAFEVRVEFSPWVGRLFEEKPARASRALLETLAIVAYRQPVTRGEIEDIRGVALASSVVQTLLEREWVHVVGHRETPGRPALYATTRIFLDHFGLKSLDELPDPGSLDALSRVDVLVSPPEETT